MGSKIQYQKTSPAVALPLPFVCHWIIQLRMVSLPNTPSSTQIVSFLFLRSFFSQVGMRLSSPLSLLITSVVFSFEFFFNYKY